VFAQSPVRQDVSEHLGVFGLDKRAAAADEVSSSHGDTHLNCSEVWTQPVKRLDQGTIRTSLLYF